MNIKNYTTDIEASKTVGEIQSYLAEQGVSNIGISYENKKPVAITFTVDIGNIKNVPVRMPARAASAELILKEMKARRGNKMTTKPDYDQACRVAWRLILDWVKVQMSMVYLGQAEMAEIFMPYITDENGQTLFERMRETQFLLPEPPI